VSGVGWTGKVKLRPAATINTVEVCTEQIREGGKEGNLEKGAV
jgi:hypothetical protein